MFPDIIGMPPAMPAIGGVAPNPFWRRHWCPRRAGRGGGRGAAFRACGASAGIAAPFPGFPGMPFGLGAMVGTDEGARHVTADVTRAPVRGDATATTGS